LGDRNNDESIHVKPRAVAVKKNGDFVNVRPGALGGKNNGNSISSRTMGTSVFVKQGNPRDKTRGSPVTDWKFQSKRWKKKFSVEPQTTKVYNRYAFFEDEIEDDELIEDTVAKNEDIEYHGSNNDCKNEKVWVERKALKENITKRKKTSSKAANGDKCTESKTICKKVAQRTRKSYVKTENKQQMRIETKNRFCLFETLTEREIEAIANYENHVDVSKVKKKCRRWMQL
jgi:hypothetical protein